MQAERVPNMLIENFHFLLRNQAAPALTPLPELRGNTGKPHHLWYYRRDYPLRVDQYSFPPLCRPSPLHYPPTLGPAPQVIVAANDKSDEPIDGAVHLHPAEEPDRGNPAV